MTKILQLALSKCHSDLTPFPVTPFPRCVVDVLAAQRELYRARRDYSRALYEYIINGLKLKHAAGVIAEQDLRQVDAWCQDKAEERIALL